MLLPVYLNVNIKTFRNFYYKMPHSTNIDVHLLLLSYFVRLQSSVIHDHMDGFIRITFCEKKSKHRRLRHQR